MNDPGSEENGFSDKKKNAQYSSYIFLDSIESRGYTKWKLFSLLKLKGKCSFFKVQNLKPYLRRRTFNWGLANAKYALYNLQVTLLISVARITVSEKKKYLDTM